MRVTWGNRPALVAMALGDFPTDAAAGVMSPGDFAIRSGGQRKVIG